MTLQPFHLAVPVHDLAQARQFYTDLIGCEEGRSDAHWVDFNLFGHQFVVHHKLGMPAPRLTARVDGNDMPIPHFGVVLKWDDWQRLAARLKTYNQEFLVEPKIQAAGQVAEQATMSFQDPSGNALEFKAFRDESQLFAT